MHYVNKLKAIIRDTIFLLVALKLEGINPVGNLVMTGLTRRDVMDSVSSLIFLRPIETELMSVCHGNFRQRGYFPPCGHVWEISPRKFGSKTTCFPR